MPGMKIYLAGPDVFRANAVFHGKDLKNICAFYGAEGLWPFDNEVAEGPEKAFRIRKANEAMIVACDAVVANIEPFRGPNMDPGTAYEIGFARALGRPVYLYTTNEQTLAERSAAFSGKSEFPFVEDFGLGENLMLAANESLYYAPSHAIRAATRGIK